MKLDIFSDTICPWCFIGKRRLERALAARPQPGLTIRWRAFQLNPTMPLEGMDRRHYFDAKFGSAERASRIYDAMRAAGAAEGIAFAFERIERTPNTLKSHRLLRLAATHGRQEQLLEALFRVYFLEGRDISDTAVLLHVAADAGLESAYVADWLDGDAEAEAALAEDMLARRHGINGVPCFVFNGRFALSGAQEPEALFQLFDLAREDDARQREEELAAAQVS
ncbi:DsbA family oxidoreductase [Rhodospirillaceae bacterium SYSU D60014]|uniref:DsbA family oxidoreductase n=1 Tax=Virgifigura deserti TaxID=2268457 RepID=UPI000E669ECE